MNNIIVDEKLANQAALVEALKVMKAEIVADAKKVAAMLEDAVNDGILDDFLELMIEDSVSRQHRLVQALTQTAEVLAIDDFDDAAAAGGEAIESKP